MKSMAQKSNRPTAIILLAIVEFLLGIFALVGGIIHLTLGIGGLADFSGRDLTLNNGTASPLQDAFTAEGVILVLASYGVWSTRKWGLKLTVFIALLGLATSLAALALQSSFSLIGIVVNIAILAYASRSPLRAYFASSNATRG